MAPVRDSGAACLLIEDDIEIVERYAARAIDFYDGRILAGGPTEAWDNLSSFIAATADATKRSSHTLTGWLSALSPSIAKWTRLGDN